MDPINVMEQPGYMAGMRAGQDWAAEAVRGVMKDQGYDAEVDSYIDSAEYQNRFGEEVVPYLHG